MNNLEEPPTEEQRGDVARLETQVQYRLIGRVRNLHLRMCDGGLVLTGQTSTYFAKQLAQEAVMQATELPVRANEIHVT